jgi:ABC-type sugar transport system ATPase subunit
MDEASLRQVKVSMNDICMSFSGNAVLDHVNFDLRQGEIHSLMGANGAGKSTLIKILNGIYLPISGDIFIEGQLAKIKSPKDAERYGLAFVHQELNICPDISVAENMYIGNWARKASGIYDKKATSRNAANLLDTMGVNLNPDAPVRLLRTAEKQIIEILKTLTREAKIIILDEPTSSLNEKEKEKFFEIIEKLQGKGVSIIFISHFLEDVIRLSDRVTVLKDGHANGVFTRDNYGKDELVEAMMGQKVYNTEFVPLPDYPNARKVIEVNNFSSAGKFTNISFSVDEGDIVGVCGLLGAGKTEIARAIFGLDAVSEGRLVISGEEIKKPDPACMIEKKVALLTEERKLEGFIPLLSIRENESLSIMRRFRKMLGINYRKQRAFASEASTEMRIKMTGVEQSAVSLSGGNQQKVVLAKCLASKPKLFLLDEPTRGVDILAKSEIYKILRKSAENGTAVIIFSSEIEELLANCSKIFILKKGELTNCVSSLDVSKNDLLTMIG